MHSACSSSSTESILNYSYIAHFVIARNFSYKINIPERNRRKKSQILSQLASGHQIISNQLILPPFLFLSYPSLFILFSYLSLSSSRPPSQSPSLSYQETCLLSLLALTLLPTLAKKLLSKPFAYPLLLSFSAATTTSALALLPPALGLPTPLPAVFVYV